MFNLIEGIVDLVWNVSQSNKIAALNAEVNRLQQSARSTSNLAPENAQLNELRAATSELRLYIAVLFRVLKAKGIIDRDELVRLLEQTDQEDGSRDQAFGGDVLP